MKKHILTLLAILLAAPTLGQQTATGVVFNDVNNNGLRDADEAGIGNVRVSNQREVTTTDSEGRYAVPVTDDTIIFVVKPRNWSTPVDKQMVPRYYYIHKPKGSPLQKHAGVAPTGSLPASVDFPLSKANEPNRFKALFFGDTQVSAGNIPMLSHVILDQLAPNEAAFGVTLGDNSADNPSLFGAISKVMATTGIPWYYSLGNHDENYDTPGEEHSTETFQSAFGPAYYSFDYGPVHFVTLDSVMWLGKSYEGGFGESQIEWLKNDLARCPKNQLVVLSMHIPISNTKDRAGVYRLLEGRPNGVVVAGHTHWMSNHFIGTDDGFNRPQPLHELINATTCGSWWGGPPDEQGMPISTMPDGAPMGYSVFSFDGSKYSVEFRAAKRPSDYQMTLFAPDEIEEYSSAPSEILANVFAGSTASTVEMRMDGTGAWTAMEKALVPDPYLTKLKAAEPVGIPGSWKFASPMKGSPHIWRGVLPTNLTPGAHVINVRTKDMYGQQYEARRVVVVK